MKFTVKIFLSLLIVAASLGAMSFLLPATCEVEQSIVLSSPPERVFQYLNNPTQWEHWSAWNKTADPTLFHMYGGPWAGVGARHSWNGEKTGKGQRVFKAVEVPLMLQYEQVLAGEADTTIGYFKLEKLEDSTRVTWHEITPLASNPLARCRGAWKKYKSEEELKKGLAGLKTLLEGNGAGKKQKSV
ncbi:SRPBCC family protein [Pontibacter sp. 13R65]|uniref:SRPBCC family protein n=1 Tax=Pontibacter sp. 13R65 TaxID=3127458 RepID=UPI00301D67AE